MNAKPELVLRVKAIGSPLSAALNAAVARDGKPPEPIPHDVVEQAARRLDALVEDIEKGLYAGE